MYTVLCALFSVNVLCFILQADALVNTTDTNFGFGGFVAQALLKAAGGALKDECVSKAPVPVGDVAVTGAGNIKCKHIIHAVLPNYDGPGGQSEKVCSICAIFLKKAYYALLCFYCCMCLPYCSYIEKKTCTSCSYAPDFCAFCLP